jgi:hypothetical protein
MLTYGVFAVNRHYFRERHVGFCDGGRTRRVAMAVVGSSGQ